MSVATGKRKKILFICNDHIGSSMAGPGIRAWELAQALVRKGHETVVLSRHFERGFSRGGLTFAGRASLPNLIAWIRRADLVIQPGRPIPIFLSLLFRKKLAFDQYDPVVFEFLERTAASLPALLAKRMMLLLWRLRQRVILRFGDAFLVANEKQKDFLIGQLAVLGYTKKPGLITVLPFGLPDVKPVKTRSVLRGKKIKETDFLLVWGGGIWGWFDPFTLLRALAKIKSQRDDIKAYFPGIRPPGPDSRKMAVTEEFLAEARGLGLLDTTVFVNPDWTPYGQRAEYLLEADAGISLHNDSLETRFAFRTRMLDYLWAGLPIIASKGDCWADVIDQRGLGATTPPNDVDAVVSAVIAMANDGAFRSRCGERAKAVAREYVWDSLADRVLPDPDRKQ
ncbi:MAG TPA: glycosyltransferase [Nitrospirota bacterium]